MTLQPVYCRDGARLYRSITDATHKWMTGEYTRDEFHAELAHRTEAHLDHIYNCEACIELGNLDPAVYDRILKAREGVADGARSLP